MCGSGQVRQVESPLQLIHTHGLMVGAMLNGASYTCTSCGKLRTLQKTDFEDLREQDVCIDD